MCCLLAFGYIDYTHSHTSQTPALTLREFHMKRFSLLGRLYFRWGTRVKGYHDQKENKQFHEIYCAIIKMCGVYEVYGASLIDVVRR